MLPNWTHTPNLARNLHTSYAQKLTSIPYYPKHALTPSTHKPQLNIYLVANEKSLRLLDRIHVTKTLSNAISNIIGKPPSPIFLNLHKADPQHLNCNHKYTEKFPPPTQPPPNRFRTQIQQFFAAHNHTTCIYSDGSRVRGSLVLGAVVVHPFTYIGMHTH